MAWTNSGQPADVSRQFIGVGGIADADDGVDFVMSVEEDRPIWLGETPYLTIGEPGSEP